eukprot:CAMPEP_0171183960 /NCGR_PEP_ID=MMETSP0790-20130122/15547_1 /TAXON_ID=2925 /ORGANISM="Alexandrium catenella, Strain OF101" /LENGTH=429 /DNA_ID=CAMNT_0011648951 /DNA_START=1 /DNA_END=1290 /DNA_ORIENTATION=-
MLELCRRGGVAVNVITAPAPGVQLDTATLQWLPWRTGGDVLHIPTFDETCSSQLADSLRHWITQMQGSAYDCVVKLRCSKGLSCKSLLAPWKAAASSPDQSAFEIPRLSPDSSMTFVLEPETEEEDEDTFYTRRDHRKQLYIQAAVLYTNTHGERLLRVHTTAVGVVTTVRALYQSVSVAPLITFIFKQAISVCLDQKQGSKILPRDMLLEFCLQVLAVYRRHCHSMEIDGPTLVTSRRLSMLPLYILSARKLLYFIMNSPEHQGNTDEHLRRLCRMPVHSVMAALYPRVYPLPAAVHEGADLPYQCYTLQEQVTMGTSPAYLITNGFGAWFYEVEGSGSPKKIPRAALRRNAEVLCQRLQEAMEPSPVWMPLKDLPRLNGSATPGGDDLSWQDQVLLSTLFVEDEGVTEMSYADWIQFLYTQVLQMVD